MIIFFAGNVHLVAIEKLIVDAQCNRLFSFGWVKGLGIRRGQSEEDVFYYHVEHVKK